MALLALAGCSDELVSTPGDDATTAIDAASPDAPPPLDLPSPLDLPRTDLPPPADVATDQPPPTRDAPTPDVPSIRDVPAIDVAPSADVPPAVDVPAAVDRPAPPDPCLSLAPGASPAANLAAIQSCLDRSRVAVLGAGNYPVSATIHVRAGATLRAAEGARPTVSLGVAQGAYTLVDLDGGGAVRGLRLNAAGLLRQGPVSAVIAVSAGDNRVDDVEVFGRLTRGDHSVGVYFVCEACTGNVVTGADIHDLFYGAIFRSTLRPQHLNTLRNGRIHDVQCDSITFAGYGVAEGNEVFHNGYDCENPPSPGMAAIPGGGVYCLENDAGAVLRANTIHDNCGHGVDMDRCANVQILDNRVSDPGYTWAGARSHCTGAAGVSLVDVRGFTIRGNVVENNNRPGNAVRHGLLGDPNEIYSPRGGSTFADLPSGGSQVIAFALVRRRSSRAVYATGNTVEGNEFRAFCEPGCVGLGYFAGRGTGTGAGGSWSAATTNYFTRNNPFGSQVGSRRCGANWYAANSRCTAGAAEAACNTDDSQHDPPAGDAFRNDPGCRDFP